MGEAVKGTLKIPGVFPDVAAMPSPAHDDIVEEEEEYARRVREEELKDEGLDALELRAVARRLRAEKRVLECGSCPQNPW